MKRSDGFTLVEVIVTLVVVAIIIAVGIPGLSSMMANNRAIANSNDLVTALSFSRNEAVKRGMRVSICAKSSAAQGNLTCSENNDNWPNGWFAFVSSTAEPLRSWPAPPGDFTMTGPVSISFNSSGAIEGDPTTLTIAYSHCTGQQNRTISIATTGHTSITKTSCT